MATAYKTYRLTTPYMQGPGVKALQTELIKRGYLQGTADGEFGPQTKNAVKDAKYWFGYLTRNINGVADATFQKFLFSGFSLLRPDMWLRRRARLAAAKKTVTTRQKLLAKAITQIGVKENPVGSNRVLYSLWYGIIGPWCAMFCSWCSSQVGSNFHYAYVPAVVQDARANRNGLRVVSYAEVLPGDFVCYDWERDGTADHIGVFEKKISSTTFSAIEGNTSVGNDSNGGEVMRRERDISLVQAFVRKVS